MKLNSFLIIWISFSNSVLFAAEAGMPQLDSKYWLSQSFWLVLIFTLLYLSLSKFFIPKIKDNLDNREKIIKENLDEAKQLSELSEKKMSDYENEMIKAKKEVTKIINDSRKQLDKNLSHKKEQLEKEINDGIDNAEKEIINMKKSSINSISKIAKDISSQVITNITGDKLNDSSIETAVSEILKKKTGNIYDN